MDDRLIDSTTRRMMEETGHACPACPEDPRNLGAVLHNLLNAYDEGDPVRLGHKVEEARRSLQSWQPILDGHFAALDGWRRP